jgi:molybdenum cofactor cytidylyltransferase
VSDRVAGVVLAAGESRRMGFPKPLLELAGETFLDRLILSFSERCSPVIAVLGYHADRVAGGIRRASLASLVTNPEPERGMLNSLQCGLRAVPDDCVGAVFTPVDYPCIQPATVSALVDALTSSEAPVVIPTHAGQRGHPVGIGRPLLVELLALKPDEQARNVIRRHRDQTQFVAVDDSGILNDVDDPEAYRRLLESLP